MARKNHDGSFRKLANGTVEYVVSVGFDAFGKHQRKRFYGKTESECRKKYKEFVEGGYVQTGNASEHTLSSWFDEWLPAYKQHKVEASTYKDYQYLASHVKAHKLGGMRLSQIKPLHVTEYFASKIELSQSFRKRNKFLLNAAFETAIDNDFCTKNPVRRAIIAKKIEPEKCIFSRDEVRTILEFAKDDELFGVAMYIMLNSGVRGQELRALTTDKIDYDHGIIRIDQAVKETGEIGLPKNGKPRIVPLESGVAEFLKTRLHGKSGYIIGGADFVTKHGFRGRYDCFFDRLNKHLVSEGKGPINGKSAHKTRHSFTTLRQHSGMPRSKVEAIVGHGAKDITDNYTHFSDVAILTETVREYPYLSWLGVNLAT
jgi:integrase